MSQNKVSTGTTNQHLRRPTVLPKKKPKMYAKQSLQTTIPLGNVNLAIQPCVVQRDEGGTGARSHIP